MQQRYIQLLDDIKNHVFQWATDEDWKKLPPKVNVALSLLINEIKIADAVKSNGNEDSSDESIRTEMKRFIAVFRKKYLEVVGFEYSSSITPVNQCNIKRTITDLNAEGGSYVDFIEWFFLDFCSIESNKEKYMPPQINLMCSKFIIDKFKYKMKDSMKVRKDMIDQQAVITMLLDIAIPMNKRIQCDNFSKKIIDLDNRVISASKFFDLMMKFAQKYNDTIGLDECNKIKEQMQNKMKSKM